MKNAFGKLTRSLSFLLFLFVLSANLLHAQNEDHKTEIDSLFSSGKYEELIPMLNQIAASDSTNYYWYYRLGTAYQNLFRFDESKALLEKANKLSPDNPKILFSLAYTLKALGLNNEAKAAYKNILEVEPQNVSALNELGILEINSGSYKTASNIYQGLIDKNSTNSYLYKQLGICQFKMNALADAAQNFETVSKINPNDISNYIRLGQIYFKLKNIDTALTLINKGLNLSRMNLELNRLKADILFGQKDFVGAVKHFLNTIVAGDTSALTYQKLGLSYYFVATSGGYPTEEGKCRKLDEGIKALKSSLEKDSSQVLTSFYIGICYKEKSEIDSAIFYLNKSIRLAFPNYISDIYTHLGLCYDKNKGYIQAIQSFKQAYEYNSAKKNILYYLASDYDKFYNDKSTAYYYYKKFVSEAVNPDKNLIEFAKDRIDKLREEMHFARE